MTGADLPLVVAGSGSVEACVGVLTFGWAGDHAVDTEEETLLVAVADLAAAAIATFRTSSMADERAEWLERVALTDPLTGLANARTVTRVLDLEVARAQRQGTEVSVALFDVDGFRELNAEAGARAGDHVLRQVATRARGERPAGGHDRPDRRRRVRARGARPRRRDRRPARARRGRDGWTQVGDHTITVSAAVARFPQDGADAETLLAAARAALAGATGRSSIVEVTRGLIRPAPAIPGSTTQAAVRRPRSGGRPQGRGRPSSTAARQARRSAMRRTAAMAPARTASGPPVASTTA